jgi:hypothetical protein
MTALTPTERDKFLRKDLRHRLTLLRTLRERKRSGHNYQGQGDIYRCVKDSNLIAVRLILDFLGLKGELDGSDYRLMGSERQRGAKFADDIKIDQFIGRLLTPADVPVSSQRILAGVYKRADKELAHLTSTFNEEFNEEDILIEAATAVEDLLQRFLYAPQGEQVPPMDT